MDTVSQLASPADDVFFYHLYALEDTRMLFVYQLCDIDVVVSVADSLGPECVALVLFLFVRE